MRKIADLAPVCCGPARTSAMFAPLGILRLLGLAFDVRDLLSMLIDTPNVAGLPATAT